MELNYNQEKGELTKDQLISRIIASGGIPDLNSTTLTLDDQLYISESLSKSHTKQQINNININNEESNASGNNATCKSSVNFILNESKLNLIQKLNFYKSSTPIYLVADTLEDLFKECGSLPTHWNYIAENYTPRSINGVLSQMTKSYGDWHGLNSPAAYFTFKIKKRKKRKNKRK